MVQWFSTDERLPEDGQECLIMPHESGSLITTHVFGPIPWDAKMKAWCDLFSTPEAGEIVPQKDVGRWTDWSVIAPSNGDTDHG